MATPLEALTTTPTVAGHEERVAQWVDRWVSRRDGLRLRADRAGNLLVTTTHRRRRAPIIVVAHMDHPGFVITEVRGRRVVAGFRGGVHDAYFEGARVEFFDRAREAHRATVESWQAEAKTAVLRLDRTGPLAVDDIGRWFFPARQLGIAGGLLRAHGCDDLAGVAAGLEMMDRARRDKTLGHLSVLLTRGEEMGFLGAIAACKSGSIPADARVISVETSRALPGVEIGGGPVVRVGDAATVFDSALSNALWTIARQQKSSVQRKLMDGGACEATAFGAYGYRAAGLALPLGNYHNMVDVDAVRAGRSEAVLGPEQIALSDFEGLVELLIEVGRHLDQSASTLVDRLDAMYDEDAWVLGRKLPAG